MPLIKSSWPDSSKIFVPETDTNWVVAEEGATRRNKMADSSAATCLRLDILSRVVVVQHSELISKVDRVDCSCDMKKIMMEL
mmetsp:Transcript_25644/g.53712  ORF Transcript_25644/g.53712 Transcript_25644/m.53712 type:complete len:82 (+) Transcript_25644:100-345(+)